MLMFLLLLFGSWVFSSVTASVSYDHKAITINGQRRILISGSIHYPRSTPEVATLLQLQCGSRVLLVLVPLHVLFKVFYFSLMAALSLSLSLCIFFLFFAGVYGVWAQFWLQCWVLWCLQMWPDLIQTAKDGGLDVIETYVFWNGHEPSPGNVNEITLLFFFFL